MKILFIANSYKYLSGGDKIFAQVAKQWIKQGHSVKIKTNQDGANFCISQQILPSHIVNNVDANSYDVVFTSSYFPEDLLLAIYIKILNKNVKLITTIYHIMPKRGLEYSGGPLKGFVLYIIQKISILFMKLFSSLTLTAMKKDSDYLFKRGLKNVAAIRGGIDLKLIDKVPKQKKIYDAVFVGRLIHQKCIPELIEFWQTIVRNNSSLKLAIIGEGPMRNWLVTAIYSTKLDNNIDFFEKLDNEEKIRIVKASRIFVTLSRYDSGNIALDEALACGVPGVLFNTNEEHFVKGVIKVKCCDIDEFADAYTSLLKSNHLTSRLSKEGLDFAKHLNWSNVANKIIKLL